MKGLALGAFALLSVTASATVDYTLRPTDPTSIVVTMKFDARGKTTVKMPNWAPGAYMYSYPGRSVRDLTVADGRAPVAATKVGDNAWTFDAKGPVTVTYTVPNGMSEGSYNVSGPSTYLYIDGRKDEDARLNLDIPAAYKVAVGLDPVSSRDDRHYKAPNYDTLADNPVMLGDILVDTYTVQGKTHYIALRGAARTKVDRKRLLQICESVTRAEGDFFGGLPYHRYVWHFTVGERPDGGGGLEHLSSTQITLPSGLGPRSVSVLAHEFFHLWNVKRIRSAPLGPFNYDELPQTGALWWLEGVTDYYANTLLPRYGIWTKEEMYGDVARNVRTVRSKPARLQVGPYEASYRVRDAANGRGNSNGYQVSYYDTGSLVGMILDLNIIDASNGKNSLDNVERELARTYAKGQLPGQKRGFEEGKLKELVTKYGGRSVGDLYETIVMKGGELPVEGALAKAGLELQFTETRTLTLPFSLNLSFEGGYPKASAKDTFPNVDGMMVTSIAGVSLAGAGPREQRAAQTKAEAALVLGQEFTVEYLDAEGRKNTFTAKPTERVTQTPKVVESANASPRQLEVRSRWLSKVRSTKPLPAAR